MEELNKIALITVMYDYPDWHQPIFLNNAKKYFEEKDIHILRYNNLREGLSYYDKFFFYKIEKVRDYIRDNIIGNYEFVLFLDATDTNFYRDPSTMIETFLTFNKSIVFCAENFMWPPTPHNHLYETKPVLTEARYLNSGAYFGYSRKILEYLEKTVENPISIDDQGSWAIRYLTNDDIEIDQFRKLFFSSLNMKNLVQIIDGNVVLADMNPYIVHDNGPYNEDTIKIVNTLNK